MGRRLSALVLSAAVPATLMALAWPRGDAGYAAATAPSPAKLLFVDVGQGDAVVARVGSKVIVSDAGEFHVDRVEQALRNVGRKRRIDVALLSHAHKDHVENFIELLERGWTIGLAVMPDSAHWRGTDTNVKLIDLLEQRRVPIELATRGETFTWGGGTWEVLNPPLGKFTGGSSQAANASIVYQLTVNGVRALFTGDIEPKVARSVAAQLAAPVDVFLATHHGSKHGSVQQLLDAVRPRWAVLSLGAGNSFGHPAREAVARLKASGASIWCTARNGTITARISAGGRLTWRASRQAAPWWSSRDRVHHGTCG